ncbi:disease resistance protein RUN1-like [Eucalyptus grandis]|uniref:disease resistance protein RUN1-like n=1 Tax=Eucalyptus grandis TaxID=71139 RepID=UPI00192EEBB9|nr:disease resistance protein RUN1-like [Eucalyptus grandis]
MDVRNNFLSHLYIAFDRNGIHSFVDSEELRKGKEISPALMRAIEESHVAIIIFSEEHASSPWCLEELVKIMECKEQKGLKVLPVFYKVEPREVKVRRKSYGRNMAKHELKFGKDSEKVKRWKKTLFDAGNLSGWDMNNRKVGIRRDLIDRALRYADGLPLALEVLGSFLYGREESAWDSTLHKLSKSPDQTINRVLKTSFDGLGGSEREIFLDIACFFKRKRIEYIKEVLDNCDFDPIIGIEILIERSLIKNVNGTLQMHDLVQLMGKDIVKHECPDDPRKCSRLWLFEEVQDILREYTRKNVIKAIVLDLPTPKEMTISPNAFTNMRRLRMFIMPKVHIFSRGPICLPNELSWLEWANYPDLEFGPGQKKLVRLHVKNGHIKQLGSNFQNFINLKSIEFCDCKFLAIVPDLSSAPNLERLYLLRCESLVEVHQSAGYLDKLKILSISSCSNLRIFPSTLKTKSLQNLDLSYCHKLEKYPDIPEKMEHLQHLDLQWMAIKELPTSIENLVSVETIDLGYCENLTRLPLSIHKLKNLKALYLYNCSNLAVFPKNLENPIYRMAIWDSQV